MLGSYTPQNFNTITLRWHQRVKKGGERRHLTVGAYSSLLARTQFGHDFQFGHIYQHFVRYVKEFTHIQQLRALEL